MRATLVICLFLATHLHAGVDVHSTSTNSVSTSTTAALDGLSVDTSNTTSSSASFNEEHELAKIAAYCMSPSDYEELTGNVVAPLLARMLAVYLVGETTTSIGLTELRAALNFGPLRPWKHHNRTEPSEDELTSAPTIEAYYDLKEPRSERRSLDSTSLLEKNMLPAIAYFDKRFPSIRTIFRRRFEEIRRFDPEVIDRKTIDRMIDEFWVKKNRVDRANDQMLNIGGRRRECDDID